MGRRRRIGGEQESRGPTAITGELGETVAAAKKRYGQRAVSLGSDKYQPPRISTGSFIMDFCLLGGIPENRCTMILGEKHAGKSLLASKIIASAQTAYPDQVPVLIDVEGTYDPVWSNKLGVDPDRLLVVDCETGEMAADMADAVISSRETSLVVVDSLAAMVPMKEADSSAEDAHVGLQARLIGGMIRRVIASLIRERKRDHYVTLLLVNQFRMKIGFNIGDPRTVPGGKATEYATSVQIIMKNKETKGKDSLGIDGVIENEHPFTITKNKLNSGPRTGEFTLIRSSGHPSGLPVGAVDNAPTLLAYAKKFGLYTGGGKSWVLAFEDVSRKAGKASDMIDMLREDTALQYQLWAHLIAMQAANLEVPVPDLHLWGK